VLAPALFISIETQLVRLRYDCDRRQRWHPGSVPVPGDCSTAPGRRALAVDGTALSRGAIWGHHTLVAGPSAEHVEDRPCAGMIGRPADTLPPQPFEHASECRNFKTTGRLPRIHPAPHGANTHLSADDSPGSLVRRSS
jgi:hypothetical protein